MVLVGLFLGRLFLIHRKTQEGIPSSYCLWTRVHWWDLQDRVTKAGGSRGSPPQHGGTATPQNFRLSGIILGEAGQQKSPPPGSTPPSPRPTHTPEEVSRSNLESAGDHRCSASRWQSSCHCRGNSCSLQDYCCHWLGVTQRNGHPGSCLQGQQCSQSQEVSQ